MSARRLPSLRHGPATCSLRANSRLSELGCWPLTQNSPYYINWRRVSL